MQTITRGGNAALPAGRITATLTFDRPSPGPDVDVSAYLLRDDGRTRHDHDMVFYGQPSTPDGGVTFDKARSTFAIDPDRLDPEVERIAICVVVDGASASTVGGISIEAGGVAFRHETAGQPESAVIVAEIYRRGGQWKIRGVGQGFAGGLSPLAKSFGVIVDDEPDASVAAKPDAPVAPSRGVSLRKQRIVSLEKTDPKLATLAKKAGVSLTKKNVPEQVARVWLVLDVSYSMLPHFESGGAQRLCDRALAYGLNLDDDGSIGVLLFDHAAHARPDVDSTNYRTVATEALRDRSLWGATDYGNAFEHVRREAARQSDFGKVPVYVMFVTDGETRRKEVAERHILEASREGIFWKFMAIGETSTGIFGGKRLPPGFDFLAKLDDMPGRKVDNADFFSMSDPNDPDDAAFFDLMAEEWAGWLAAARTAGVLR
jgi:stress response protein SCP2